MTPPSTSRPQDAFRAPRLGRWRCRVCVPNVVDAGGLDAFEAHYNRHHLDWFDVAPPIPVEGSAEGQPPTDFDG